MKISDLNEKITGYATNVTTGYVNITIVQTIALNLTRGVIDWGSGSINSGEVNATLYTDGDNNGTVIRGNWTGENAKALILQNIGGVNASITIKTDKDAHDFFNSSSGTNERYMLNVTQRNNSCSGGDYTLGQWADVNLTGAKYCNHFNYQPPYNTVYIDVLLTVPKDANKIGYLSDFITVIGDFPI
jgi:hypothetical protein